jgi:pimeloyl-ACP methyl ester carboxylesterase
MIVQPRYVCANGTEFAYLTAGKGPLVLCLHGFPDTAWSMRSTLAALADAGFRGVAPFMRGYAPSSVPPDGDYRIHTLGRDVLALAQALGGRQVRLVGHDWGAVAAYVAAAMNPKLVGSIVCAAVPHLRRFLLRPSRAQLWRSRYMLRFQLPGAGRLVTRPHWLDALVREWSPGWRFSDSDLAPVRALLADAQHRAALLGYYRQMQRGLRDARAWRLAMMPTPVPACVINGAQDGCIGPEMFDTQEHLFAAGLERVVLPDAGHFMHCEQPDAFAAAVIAFLRPAWVGPGG